MPIVKERKTALVQEYRTHNNDTGSPEVQVALLTERINQLTEHLKGHRKDFSTQRGLLMMVSQRATLLKYLVRHDQTRYQNIIKRLGIRK